MSWQCERGWHTTEEEGTTTEDLGDAALRTFILNPPQESALWTMRKENYGIAYLTKSPQDDFTLVVHLKSTNEVSVHDEPPHKQ